MSYFAQTESDWTVGDDILALTSTLCVTDNVTSFLQSCRTMNRLRLRR